LLSSYEVLEKGEAVWLGKRQHLLSLPRREKERERRGSRISVLTQSGRGVNQKRNYFREPVAESGKKREVHKRLGPPPKENVVSN